MTGLERFDRHVMALDDSPDTCWIWTGSLNAAGYGRFREGGRGGKIRRAHRVAWALLHGSEPPTGQVLRHTCNQPLCVRHWELGGPLRKLTDEQRARAARSGASTGVLARHYGVTTRWIRALRVRCGLSSRPYTDCDGGVSRLDR